MSSKEPLLTLRALRRQALDGARADLAAARKALDTVSAGSCAFSAKIDRIRRQREEADEDVRARMGGEPIRAAELHLLNQRLAGLKADEAELTESLRALQVKRLAAKDRVEARRAALQRAMAELEAVERRLEEQEREAGRLQSNAEDEDLDAMLAARKIEDSKP